MTDTVIRVFRSDFTVLMRLLTKLAFFGSALLVLATVIGQARADRFPSYYDLVLSLLISPAACAALGLVFYAAVIAFPVKLLADGIRCYDMTGRYRTVNCADINAVEFINVYGLPYVAVHSPTLSQPITLPVWLKNMPDFIRILEAQAGKNHILVQALHEATTVGQQ